MAHPDSEYQASPAQLVYRSQGPGEQDRVPVGQDDDAGTQGDATGHGGKRAKDCQRLVEIRRPPAGRPCWRIHDQEAGEAKLLGFSGDLLQESGLGERTGMRQEECQVQAVASPGCVGGVVDFRNRRSLHSDPRIWAFYLYLMAPQVQPSS